MPGRSRRAIPARAHAHFAAPRRRYSATMSGVAAAAMSWTMLSSWPPSIGAPTGCSALTASAWIILVGRHRQERLAQDLDALLRHARGPDKRQAERLRRFEQHEQRTLAFGEQVVEDRHAGDMRPRLQDRGDDLLVDEIVAAGEGILDREETVDLALLQRQQDARGRDIAGYELDRVAVLREQRRAPWRSAWSTPSVPKISGLGETLSAASVVTPVARRTYIAEFNAPGLPM